MTHSRFPITRRAFAGILAAAAGPLVPSSYAKKLRAEAMPGANFAQYKTFEWLPPKLLTNTGVVENHPVIGPAMRDAIGKALVSRGLTEVPQGGDLQVSAMALTASIPQLEAVVFGGPDMMYGTPIATMGRYNRQGTLVINLIDTKTKKSAWVGMIEDTIDREEGAGRKKLPEFAAKLLKKYPNPK